MTSCDQHFRNQRSDFQPRAQILHIRAVMGRNPPDSMHPVTPFHGATSNRDSTLKRHRWPKSVITRSLEKLASTVWQDSPFPAHFQSQRGLQQGIDVKSKRAGWDWQKP